MIGFLCATPYHIMAAATMASDMFANEKTTLIVLDHFAIDEALVEKMRNTGVFTDVILFKSNNKSLGNKLKRLAQAFVPHPLIRSLAKRKDFTHFFCFALDFLNISYLMHAFRKNQVDCTFSYADDGIGSYINEGIYQPNGLVKLLMAVNGRANELENIKTLYLYKPAYAVVNKEFEFVEIQQSETSYQALRRFVSEIWPFTEQVDFKDAILYFEQPKEGENGGNDTLLEQKALQKAKDLLGTEAFVKLHPRSFEKNDWSAFHLLKTRIPFEAMFLQTSFEPKLFMTDNSTAVFSPYMLNGGANLHCKTIFLNRLLHNQTEDTRTRAIDEICAHINEECKASLMESPATEEDFENILKTL